MQTDRVRAIYERLAPRYERRARLCEGLLRLAPERRWIASFAEGDVLEIAIGTGRNLACYPPKRVNLTGVDLTSSMLTVAKKRADELGLKVVLQTGDAALLNFRDESFDTIVITLALCTIPNDRRAVAEAKRVLRPGGYLLLLEHVRSDYRIVRAAQRLLEPLSLKYEGDHLLREPLEHVQAEGFEVEQIHRSHLGIFERLIAKKLDQRPMNHASSRISSSPVESTSSDQDGGMRPLDLFTDARRRSPIPP